MTTLAGSAATDPSVALNVKLSVPLKPGAGRYVAPPPALTVAVPCAGAAARLYVSGSPLASLQASVRVTSGAAGGEVPLVGRHDGPTSRWKIARPLVVWLPA